MKYYIPTSSLNLDAILQSESISPVSYYHQRKSGYDTFEQIAEFASCNSIVLFDYPISFQIHDTGRYNYPMLIEVEDNIQFQDVKDSKTEGVHFCLHSIALTPKNCRLFFFSEQAFRLTTINTKDNRSIKYYKDYKIFPTTTGLALKPMPKFESLSVIINESHENVIDKMKGVCYGSFLGQKMSVNSELAHQLYLSQKIYDILTNIISMPSSASSFQRQLKILLDEYRKCDHYEKKNEIDFNKRCDTIVQKHGLDRTAFLAALKDFGLYKDLCDKLNCQMLPIVSELTSKQDFESLRSIIEQRTITCVKSHRDEQKVSAKGFEKAGGRILLKQYPLINVAINYIIDRQLTPDMLMANRLAVCVEMLKLQQAGIIKEKGDAYWNNSMEKEYFNSLFYHIKDGADFSIKSIENKEFIAIASFILRGNSIGNYFDYLVLNEIEDYQLPLTLWGALCGYMEMDREILRPILTMEAFKLVYELIYDQNTQYKTSIGEDIDEKKEEPIDGFEELMANIVHECKGAERDEGLYKKLYNEHGGLTQEFVEAVIADTSFNKGRGIQKGVKDYLNKQIKRVKKQTKPANKQKQIEFSSSGHFIDDYDFLVNNTEFLSLMSQINKKWEEDLRWFFDAHNPSHEDHKYYQGKSVDNNTVINQFLNLKNGKYRSAEEFLTNLYLK